MISRIRAGLAVCAASAFLYACGSGGGEPTAVVTPPPQRASLPLALATTVQDATTKLPLNLTGTDKVTVAVYGTDADKVVDGNGNSIYNATAKLAGPMTSSTGIFTLYIKPTTTGAFSYNVRVVASAPNYVTSSQNVVITNTDLNADGTVKTIDVPILLVSQAPGTQPPSVVAAQATTTASSTGALTQAVVLTTPTSTTTSVVNGVTTTVSLGTANASLPAAVVAYADAAKTVPLPAGTVSVNVVYNNNTTADSLATFPGGFVTQQDPAGQPLASPGGFISGGFASIEVSTKAADGTVTKAKTFSTPISVTISLPKDTINPNTGVAVKTGDTIPIWSYDSTTGAWSVMKLVSNGAIITGTVGALGADNTYPVTFQTDHLSYFNLDWFFWKNVIPGVSSTPMCDTAPITITGAQGRPLLLFAELDGHGWAHPWFLDPGTPDPAQDKITYAPKGLPMTISAYYGTSFVDPPSLVGSAHVNDVCGGVTIDVSAGMARLLPTIQTASMDFNVHEVCSNDATKSTPVNSDTIVAVAAGVPIINTGTDANGLATVKGLIVGKTYQFTVTNRDGQKSIINQGVAGTNPPQTVTFPVTCKPVSGAG